MKAWHFSIPFPPSVNGYWRTFKNRQIISKRGREYRHAAIASMEEQLPMHDQILCRVKVRLDLYVPCRRKRDIDNYTKAALDAITHAGVWLDDEQVDDLRIVRKPLEKGGRVFVQIVEM